MTQPHDEPQDESTDVPEGGARDLDEAAAQLRSRPDALPVEVADRVLQRALAVPRPAGLVRAHPPHDYLQVSTTVIVSLLRQRLDQELARAAVRRVRCDATRDLRLEGVALELVVQFGQDLRVVGEQAREVARGVLAEVLGRPVAQSEVTVQHVHVGDITVGDPRLVDPGDE